MSNKKIFNKFEKIQTSINKNKMNYDKKVEDLYKIYVQEIEKISFILEGIDNNSFGRIVPTEDNIKISNDKEIRDFFFLYSNYSQILISGIYTLKSIQLLFKNDCSLGDIMALLRRYTEALYIFIFFIFIEKNYNKFEKKEKDEIKEWLNSKNKKLLDFRKINSFIINNKIIDEILDLLEINFRTLQIKRDKTNDFIHYNGFIYLNNTSQDFNRNFNDLEQLLDEVKLYTKIFIIFCMTKCEYYCTSIDYINHLEMGGEHIEGLQYITMPVLDKYIIENFNTVELDYIKNNSNLKFGSEADLFMESIKI